MNVILLSGGSGKRLWPLSNEIRSKQFIKLFKNEDDSYSSMVQRVYGQIKRVDPNAVVTVATSKEQVSAIRNQLGDDVGISIEPCRRDTFPAIALAVAFLHDVLRISEEEIVVVCPVDPYVDDTYFEGIKQLCQLAGTSESNLTLMGIEPTYPSEKYGYIIPHSSDPVSKVLNFKEKPDQKTAEKYIAQGALWNGGVFAFRLGYVWKRAHELIEFSGYEDLFAAYDTVKKISFDYAVVEHEPSIQVMRYHGAWKDVGTWNTLTEVMEEDVIGNGILSDTCENTQIINELDMPILCTGLKNVVVAASPQGILVSDKEQSSYIKPLVDAIEQPVMYAETSWGSYRIVDITSMSMTIKVTLLPGHRMNYHSHERREEIWNVVEGTGKVILDGDEMEIKPGDVIRIPVGCRHTVVSYSQLQIMEIQIGEEIDAEDKVIYTS